jgi:hypothetical protein
MIRVRKKLKYLVEQGESDGNVFMEVNGSPFGFNQDEESENKSKDFYSEKKE